VVWLRKAAAVADMTEAISEDDVLVATWGEGATWVDYYLVLSRSPKMVLLQPVTTEVVRAGPVNNEVLPNTLDSSGETFRKKVKTEWIHSTGTVREVVELGRWVGAPVARVWNGERNLQSSWIRFNDTR